MGQGQTPCIFRGVRMNRPFTDSHENPPVVAHAAGVQRPPFGRRDFRP
jgi:hypothetical protein